MRILLAGLLLTAASLAAADVTLYVAPRGNDGEPGSAQRPFRSLTRAQEAVRDLVAEGLDGDVRVELRAGTYELNEPLVLGPEDSGSAEHSVTWAAADGADVIVSGGKRITGWKKAEGELWTAQVPEGRHFRELFVSGRRATRARTPNADADPWFVWLKGAEQAEDLSVHRLMLDPENVGDWSNVTDIEVVVLGEWEITRKLLEAVDPEAGVVTLRPPHVKQHPAINPRANMACYFENALEMLDQPGEWTLDQAAGVLTYWPLPGENPSRAEFVAPVLTRLVDVKGTEEEPVRNLHFEGIQFSHCAWPLPEAGHAGVQGTFHTPPPDWGQGWTPVDAALVWEYAQGCSFTNGRLAQLGGAGIRLRQGCRENLVAANEITDLAGSGVMVGEHLPSFDWENETLPEQEAVIGNRIEDNHIHACGREYYGGVGVWVGFAEGTVVAHNEVHAMPYTGVSVGWRWNDTPTACKSNVVEYNHIHDVMGVLADGGCIYTLGLQPGTVLRGNVLHDIHYSPVARQSSRSNNGIFFDEGSREFTVEGNVIYGAAGGPIRFNQCQQDWHTWLDNHFGITVPGEGKQGLGLRCDGGFVEEPHAAGLDATELTAEAWIWMDAYPSGDSRRWIVNKNGNEWRESHWALMVRGPDVGAYLNIGGGEANMLEAWSGDEPLELNTWHHIACTYDGEDLRAYCDGEQVAETKIGRERTPGATPLSIARRQDGYNTFTGRIDEVAVYDRALTPDEVKARFEAGGGEPTDAARYWSFEEAAGDVGVLEEAMKLVGPRP